MSVRWKRSLALGAAGITVCLVVDILAVVVGAAAAGSAARILDPIAGILIALAIGVVVLGLLRRRRRLGTRCGAHGCSTKGNA